MNDVDKTGPAIAAADPNSLLLLDVVFEAARTLRAELDTLPLAAAQTRQLHDSLAAIERKTLVLFVALTDNRHGN